MDAKVNIKPKVEVVKEPIHNLLLPGEMGAVLELTVKDKQGKVTSHRVMKSRSFVRQFIDLLWVVMNGLPQTTPLSIKDITNTARNIFGFWTDFDCKALATVVTKGIIVGTGTTAPTITDYVIETIIAHGNGAGQLEYSAVVVAAVATDATKSQVTITRDFANDSGGEITVNEIALYVVGYDGATRNFMVLRDVIPGGKAVPDGQTLTVNYRPQVVV